MGRIFDRIHPRTFGARGERVAVRFLRRRGYHILKTNYRCPAGEIDIIAAEGDTLVFVEVKTRRSDETTHPENSVTLSKQRKVTQAARYFVAQMAAEHIPARFDVISIVTPPRGKPIVEHFVDAFTLPSGRR